MGEVYGAMDTHLKRVVATKVRPKSLAAHRGRRAPIFSVKLKCSP
jgi:hypothetical protein